LARGPNYKFKFLLDKSISVHGQWSISKYTDRLCGTYMDRPNLYEGATTVQVRGVTKVKI